MKPLIEFEESALDSPVYRLQVQQTEQSLWQLESSVKQLLKSTKNGVEAAEEYSQKNTLFAQELEQLSREEADEEVISGTLQRFAGCIKEIEKSRQIMLQQLQSVFMEPLDLLIKRDIANIKESKKGFEKGSDQSDSALDKYLSKRVKDQGIQEAAEELAASRKDFHERSVSYAQELNDFQYRKRPDLIENVLAYMYTQFSFFHQAYDVMKDIEPSMREMTSKLNEIRQFHENSLPQIKEKSRLHLKQSASLYSPLSGVSRSSVNTNTPNSTPSVKAGYLIKKGSGQIRTVWSRRWFTLKGDYLLYSTRGKDEPPTVAVNLRLCMVKPTEQSERRFCFDVISPHKSYTLQAENEREMKEWIEYLQKAITNALNSEHSAEHLMKGLAVKEKLDQDFLDADQMVSNSRLEANQATLLKIESIKQMPGNDVCADCGQQGPEWASVNLGVLLCIECSGIHRSLGVHVSKVRSLNLDKWDSESYEIMLSIGNQKANEIFEHALSNNSVTSPNSSVANNLNTTVSTSSSIKPKAKSDRAEKEQFITAKYVARHYVTAVKNNYGSTAVRKQFWNACCAHNYCEALRSIAMGANIDYENSDSKGRTAFLEACCQNDQLSVQFLLLWNADVSAVDQDGYTALHYAVLKGNLWLVEQLLKRNVKYDVKAQSDGKTPIDLALELANPDLVTMLRMHKFELEQQQANSHRIQQIGQDSFSNSRPVSRQATAAENSTSNQSNSQSGSTPLQQAQQIAGNAAAYANRLLKTGFAKIHQDNSPPKTNVPSNVPSSQSTSNASNVPQQQQSTTTLSNTSSSTLSNKLNFSLKFASNKNNNNKNSYGKMSGAADGTFSPESFDGGDDNNEDDDEDKVV